MTFSALARRAQLSMSLPRIGHSRVVLLVWKLATPASVLSCRCGGPQEVLTGRHCSTRGFKDPRRHQTREGILCGPRKSERSGCSVDGAVWGSWGGPSDWDQWPASELLLQVSLIPKHMVEERCRAGKRGRMRKKSDWDDVPAATHVPKALLPTPGLRRRYSELQGKCCLELVSGLGHGDSRREGFSEIAEKVTSVLIITFAPATSSLKTRRRTAWFWNWDGGKRKGKVGRRSRCHLVTNGANHRAGSSRPIRRPAVSLFPAG